MFILKFSAFSFQNHFLPTDDRINRNDAMLLLAKRPQNATETANVSKTLKK